MKELPLETSVRRQLIIRIARRIDPFDKQEIMSTLREIPREEITTAFDSRASVGAQQSPVPCW